MELGDKLKELHLTEEEMGKLSKAFKDEKFRKMLRDYAEEISDPENKRKYEEDIAILERERGNSIEFIHPTPFKCMKTSVNGKQKGYINLCANDKIGKPSCKRGESEDGRSGLHWSLPHSLHPERKEVDAKGNRILIYDVIFHPDTIHMAGTNNRFMDMVKSVAVQGIQDAFKVNLDTNMKVMSKKYKGIPQACVLRKAIPGFKAKKDKDDPMAFPYPDENKTTTSNNKETGNCQSKLPNTREPTKPHYTVKYRSFIDLQDFRCSPDSGQSPRPKEIVITIDLPLLKSVTDTNLEVKEKSLLLESENPAYKLDLPLAYPVDEEKGEAKFNKQTRCLIITLPVLPSTEGFELNSRLRESGCEVKDDAEELEKGSGMELDEEKEVPDRDDEEQTRYQRKNAEQACEEIREREEEEEVAQKTDIGNAEGQEKDEELMIMQSGDEQEDGAKMEAQEKGVAAVKEDKGEEETKNIETVGECEVEAIRETKSEVQFSEREKECEDVKSCSESEVQICEETQEQQTVRVKVQAFTEVETMDAASSVSIDVTEEPATEPAKRAEDLDEDDLTPEQVFEKPKPKNNLPPVSLREINEDGSERVITDHVTSAGFSFQNSLMFELD